MDATPNYHPASVIWLTGLSGAGKTTIAEILFEEFKKQKKPVELLDGDIIRKLFPNTGFSKEARIEHIKRVAFTASRLEQHGINVIVSLISPFEESREFAKSLCKNFHEIYIATPLEECQRRDPKGLYKKYNEGLIKNLSGVDEIYEAPKNPKATINTIGRSPLSCAEEILRLL